MTERIWTTEYILYFGLLIGFSCQADNYKIPAQQQAVNVVRHLQSQLLHDTKDAKTCFIYIQNIKGKGI